MSTYPTEPGPPSTYIYTPPPTNALGIAGFVVSLSGLIVCLGLTCPIGLVMSLIALTKEPRGYAIAGSLIGFIGSIAGTFFILMLSGVIGTGGLFGNPFYYQSQTAQAMYGASSLIDQHFMSNNDTLPDEPTGNALITTYIDEWSNNLKYEPTQGSATDYTITSAGPDGVFGNGDDQTQYFTAYNWNAQAVPDDITEEIDDEDIEAAFGLAAEKIVKSFPPDAALPTTEQVKARAGVLQDAWQTPLKYAPSDNPPYYNLKSAGPDRTWDTDDDITKSFYFAPEGESDGPL